MVPCVIGAYTTHVETRKLRNALIKINRAHLGVAFPSNTYHYMRRLSVANYVWWHTLKYT